jgi:hypothetical protein
MVPDIPLSCAVPYTWSSSSLHSLGACGEIRAAGDKERGARCRGGGSTPSSEGIHPASTHSAACGYVLRCRRDVDGEKALRLRRRAKGRVAAASGKPLCEEVPVRQLAPSEGV